MICYSCKKKLRSNFGVNESILDKININDIAIRQRNIHILTKGVRFCSIECMLSVFPICKKCGEISDIKGSSICSNCLANINGSRNSRRNPETGLYSYNYSPLSFIYHGLGTSSKLYYGVEFEIELSQDISTQNIVRYIKTNQNNTLYCVHDGSLRKGVEIVVHPFTWEWLQSNPDELELIYKLQNNGCSTPSTCGLHVHLSRGAFKNREHIFKFANFIYQNKEFAYTISGRSNNSRVRRYCSLSGGVLKNHIDGEEAIMRGKYHAVNFSHSDTIEVRIFQGTLDKHVFLRYMEFCKALFEFTKVNSLKESIYLDSFIKYVKSGMYPNFSKLV